MTLVRDWQAFFSLQWQRRSAPLQHSCCAKDDQVNDGGDYEQGDGVTDDQDEDGGDEEDGVTDDQFNDGRDEEVFDHLAFADLAVSARQPAGAGDRPGQSGVG